MVSRAVSRKPSAVVVVDVRLGRRSSRPFDQERGGRLSLRLREGHRHAAPDLNNGHALSDGRAQRPVSGVEDLMAEEEAIAVDCHHTATDVQDVAHPELSEIAHVAIERHARSPRPGERAGIEAERVEQARRRVLESLEVVRDREVIDVVDFPAMHGPAVGLDPAHGAQASHGSGAVQRPGSTKASARR